MVASFRKLFMPVAFAIAFQLIFIGSGAAQNIRRAVLGSVKDDKGQPVQDAIIEIYRSDGGYKRGTKSNAKGEFGFILGSDNAGTYFLGVKKEGFQTQWKDDVKPEIDEFPPRIEFMLTPGESKEYPWEWVVGGRIEFIGGGKQFARKSKIKELYDSGVKAYQERNYDQAIKYLTDASELDPKESWIWFYLGLASAKKGMHTEATHGFYKAIEWDTNNQAVDMLKADVLAKSGNIDDVLTDLKKAADMTERLSSTNAARYYTYIGMSQSVSDKDKNIEAIKAFKRAIEIKSEFPEAHYYLGLVLAKNQDTVCEAALELKVYLILGTIPELMERAQQLLRELKNSKCLD
jgi:Tfp pilus assembly protein PilF